MSGGPSTAAVKADNLKKLGILVEQSRPWYEALGMTAERASGILGEDGDDYVSEQGSGLGRKAAELLFSAADVDALKPVCVVFKALFDAVKVAATNRDDLIDLIGYGVLIVKSIPETGPTSGLSPAVKYALQAFGAEVESVMQLAGSFGIAQQPTARRRVGPFKRRAREVVNSAEINKVIRGHVTQFDRIVGVIGAGAAVQSVEEAKAVLAVGKAAARTQLSIAAVFGAVLFVFAAVIFHMISGLRPPPLPDMAVVPAGALAVFGAVFFVFAAVIFHMISGLRPPTLPDLAAVPRGAISLTDAHVSRPLLLGRAVGYLTNTALGGAPCVLAGMAGGGKSLLASAVVRDDKVREHFRAGMFWWRVNTNAKDQLHEWLEGLALRVASASGTTPPRLDSLEDVTRYLKAECANAHRLVVLDDVWEREIVDALKLTGLQLLVTTRDRSVVSMPGECIELGDMEEGEALEVLKVGCGAPKSLELPRSEVLQVVDDCGKLPLALGLAAPLLKGPPQDPKSWRTLHEALHKAMTSRLGTDRVMTVPARVDALLDLSMGAMADDPAKQKRCLFLAVLAPGTLARFDMLQDLWDEAPGATKTFAAHLVDQSMLQPVGDAFRVHDLVLHFLKLKLKADPSRPTATGRTMEHLGQLKVLQRFVGAGETSDGVYSLMALWRSVENLAQESHVAAVYTKILDGVPDGAPWHQAGRLLQLMGKYTDAEPLYERCQAIFEKSLGPEHPNVAKMLNNRALLLVQQSKYGEAGPLYERSLAIREKTVGPDHPAVAIALLNLAGLREEQGKFNVAGPLYVRALEILGVTVGEEHPDYASALGNRAKLLSEQGDYAEADRLYLRAIEIGERTLGPDHPDLASRLNNRAVLLEKQGKYAEAGVLYERCQAILEKVFGPDHPDVTTVRNHQAMLLEVQGNYVEAAALLERSKAKQQEVLGPDHLSWASSLKYRAQLFYRQGRYTEAELLYERCKEIREKALGTKHPDVAEVLNGLALLWMAQGKYGKADPLLERCLSIYETALGPEHPSVATALNNRGEFLRVLGYAGAMPLFERSQAIRETVLGLEHPDVAMSLNNRAGLLQAQGKYTEAEPLYERCQAIYEKSLGPENPEVAKTLNNRAMSLFKQDKYAEVDALYERSQAIDEKVHGPDHLDVAKTLDNRGKYTKAEPLYERCQAIEEKVLGPEHPSLATTLDNRAELLRAQGKYEQAEPLYERSQAIREKMLGPEHTDVAQSLNHRAGLLKAQGKPNEALPLLERASSIRRKMLGKSYHSMVDTRISLERVRKHIPVNTRLGTPGDEKQAGPTS